MRTTITREYKCFSNFLEDVKKLSLGNNKCWIRTYCFGGGFITAYDSPGRIPYNAVGDTSFNGTDGYYRNGVHFEFSESKKRRFDNSALGCE